MNHSKKLKKNDVVVSHISRFQGIEVGDIGIVVEIEHIILNLYIILIRHGALDYDRHYPYGRYHTVVLPYEIEKIGEL